MPATHASERMPQFTHAAPPAAHAPAVGATHTLPWQQPAGHVDGSHTHAPPAHFCPALHAAAAPQWQLPSAAHASAFVTSHAEHDEPLSPHVASAFVWQTCAASQHPLGQLVALQVPPVQLPFMHVWAAPHAGPAPHRHAPDTEQLSAFPAAHAAQVSPGPAHADADSVWHTPPAQQPVLHDDESHTHVPPTHRVPAPQAAPAPQPHPPVVALHWSASLPSHATHIEPFDPHVDAVGCVQTVPLQHPFGHEVALQPQPVAPHDWPVAH